MLSHSVSEAVISCDPYPERPLASLSGGDEQGTEVQSPGKLYICLIYSIHRSRCATVIDSNDAENEHGIIR